MSDRSKIEWTDASWNPITGCVEVSEGCDHCYARTFAERFRGVPGHPYEQGFDPKLWPKRLEQPLRWRRPRMIFVNSMSDLFQDAVPDEFIAKVFGVMCQARWHTFQVLTKRPGRMASLLKRPDFIGAVQPSVEVRLDDPDHLYLHGRPWPPKNVWLGTSVENQKWADVRIPKLLETQASVRFLSCEPLLGPLDLSSWLRVEGIYALDGYRHEMLPTLNGGMGPNGRLHWVIAGGESGPGARPMDPKWARSLRDQCVTAGVPFFFKQWGGRTPKAGGRALDGRTWDAMPSSDVPTRRWLEPLQV